MWQEIFEAKSAAFLPATERSSWDFRVAEHCNWRLPLRFCLLVGRRLRILILRASCGLSVFLRVAERIWLHESFDIYSGSRPASNFEIGNRHFITFTIQR